MQWSCLCNTVPDSDDTKRRWFISPQSQVPAHYATANCRKWISTTRKDETVQFLFVWRAWLNGVGLQSQFTTRQQIKWLVSDKKKQTVGVTSESLWAPWGMCAWMMCTVCVIIVLSPEAPVGVLPQRQHSPWWASAGTITGYQAAVTVNAFMCQMC